MKYCVTCGDALHPERAEKYDYCMKPDCQAQNLTGPTIVAVGVNKSADQFMILDDETREEVARGSHHDPRRGSFGTPDRSPAYPRPEQSPPKRPSVPPTRRSTARPARPRWSRAQQNLAVLYNEQGLNPDQIADKLGLSRYTVTQMILSAPRRRR